MPHKRLPVLETAGFDVMAQIEGMLRQARLFQREVQRIRDIVQEGDVQRATLLLTEGFVVSHMVELRKECVALGETIDLVESILAEERAAQP